MRGITGLVLGLGVVVLGVGCKEKAASYCCTAETCETRVTCDEGAYCDEKGAFAPFVPRTCVPNPFMPDGGGACQLDPDCTDPGTPRCVEETCVQCRSVEHCTASLPVCSPTGSCSICTAPSDCATYAPGLPHCSGDGACVECLPGEDHCDGASDKPVCDDNTCRGCQSDGECGANGLCDEGSGKCIPPANIVHVRASAAGGPGCGTSSSPCKTIGEGVAATVPPGRIWVLVAAGDYAENLVIDGKKVNIVGAPLVGGAPVVEMQPGGLNSACALVTGDAEVRFERVRMHGAGTSSNADGLRCAIGSASSLTRLTLVDVLLDGNVAQGLDLNGCDVDATGLHVRENTGGGVLAFDSRLKLHRSRVDSNMGGGLNLNASDFDLVNNFIVDNGSPSSTFGGVLISMNPPSGAAGGRFEFNTVSANDAANTFSSGVQCSVAVTLAFENNIVYANEPDPTPTIGQVSGLNCKWTHSNIGPGLPVAGEGNVNLDPSFENSGAGDYHLDDDSLVKNLAEDDSAIFVDFDGDTRPSGGAWDMGADEVTGP